MLEIVTNDKRFDNIFIWNVLILCVLLLLFWSHGCHEKCATKKSAFNAEFSLNSTDFYSVDAAGNATCFSEKFIILDNNPICVCEVF